MTENKRTLLDEILSQCQLTLTDLYISQLDEQIKRVKNLKVEAEKIKQQQKFVNALQNLRNIIYQNIIEDLKNECNIYYTDYIGYDVSLNDKPVDQVRADILNRFPVLLAQQTATMLKQLEYIPSTQQTDVQILTRYGQQYQEICTNTPAGNNFLKGVTSVVFSGIGLVLGMTVGAVYGFWQGLQYCFIGSLFTTPYHAYKTGVNLAQAGNRVGKWLTNAPKYSSTLRHLLFKPPAMESAAMQVAEKAIEFIAPKPQSKRIEHNEEMPLLKSCQV